MKSWTVIIISIFPLLVTAQDISSPEILYPKEAYGMNAESVQLKGIKSRVIQTFVFGDTLFEYNEYDKEGRLIKKYSSDSLFYSYYSRDTTYYSYDDSNEWKAITLINGDTLATKSIDYNRNKKPTRIIIKKPDKTLSYEIKQINDTVIEFHQYGGLFRTIFLDRKNRIKRFERPESESYTTIQYFKDSTVEIIYDSKGDTSVLSITKYAKNEMLFIDETYPDESNRYRRKWEYDSKGNKIAEYFGIYYQGEFVYGLVANFEYDRKKRLLKETRYNGGRLFWIIDYEYNSK